MNENRLHSITYKSCSREAAINATADHAEILDAGAQQGLVKEMALKEFSDGEQSENFPPSRRDKSSIF